MLRKIIAAATIAASVAAVAPTEAFAQDRGHDGGYARSGYGGDHRGEYAKGAYGGHGERWAGRNIEDGGGNHGRAGHGQRWGYPRESAYYSGNGHHYSQPTVRWGDHGQGHPNGNYRH